MKRTNKNELKETKKNKSEEKVINPFKSEIGKLINSQIYSKLPIKKISYDTKKESFKSINDINIIEQMKKEINTLKRTIEERNEKGKKL